ncbi:MAG: TIM barrel protein [Saprospiraceae bacterium]|nr:TIM barrel protein [Saprospiraceae bacterium]
MKRRNFIKSTGCSIFSAGLIGVAISSSSSSCQSSNNSESSSNAESPGIAESPSMFFEISLAQWSLNKTLFDGKMDNLDFAATAKKKYGITNIEYVNQFFKDKARDKAYLQEMNTRANDLGVKQLIIMIDGEGGLGDLDDSSRKEAVENHYEWVEAAKFLGCHSIRVNAYGEGTAKEVKLAAIDGLGSLSSFAKDFGINVIVENHGGYSSNGRWLADVMKQVDMENCGTLPDFGNFCITEENDECVEEYDRYKGVLELMPYAKAVSAKSHDFNAEGDETRTDYLKMMKIVKDAGYSGYVGIEYEGSRLSEAEGILATKKLLEKVGTKLL